MGRGCVNNSSYFSTTVQNLLPYQTASHFISVPQQNLYIPNVVCLWLRLCQNRPEPYSRAGFFLPQVAATCSLGTYFQHLTQQQKIIARHLLFALSFFKKGEHNDRLLDMYNLNTRGQRSDRRIFQK